MTDDEQRDADNLATTANFVFRTVILLAVVVFIATLIHELAPIVLAMDPWTLAYIGWFISMFLAVFVVFGLFVWLDPECKSGIIPFSMCFLVIGVVTYLWYDTLL